MGRPSLTAPYLQYFLWGHVGSGGSWSGDECQEGSGEWLPGQGQHMTLKLYLLEQGSGTVPP